MKSALFLIFFLIAPLSKMLAQVIGPNKPELYGGSKEDVFLSIDSTFDGGFIAVGYTWSTDFDATTSRGSSDMFIVKVNSGNGVDWKKTYGGSGFETAFAVRQTLDSGYLVAGDTYFSSNSGDVGLSKGAIDAWVLKLDKLGNITWKRSYGGSESDGFAALQLATDGFIAVGYTASNNGDVTQNQGGDSDGWVVRCNADGSIKWQKTFGGSKRDEFTSIVKVNSDWVVCGFTLSTDGDIAQQRGFGDAWVLRLNDTNGAAIWQKTYGGSDSDLFLSVKTQRVQTTDYVLLAGASLSNNGDVSGNKGKSDGWLARLDAADGSVNWSKLYGGTADERLNDVIFDKDKTTILAVGYTESTDGDATGTFSTFGGGDAWLLRTKLDGNFEVGRRIGGTLKDVAFGVMQIKTKYDGYYVVGSTKSTDGYLNGIINRGGASDACLFRPVTISTTKEIASFSDLNIKLSPNPTSDNVWLNLKQTPSVPDLFSITNVFGQVVLTDKISDLNFPISTKNLSNGLYFLTIEKENQILGSQKLVVQH